MAKQIDYASLQETYGGKFVAIREGEIVASAETHGELVRILGEKNLDNEEVVFEYVKPKGRACAY
jgi:hypothetical protein